MNATAKGTEFGEVGFLACDFFIRSFCTITMWKDRMPKDPIVEGKGPIEQRQSCTSKKGFASLGGILVRAFSFTIGG